MKNDHLSAVDRAHRVLARIGANRLVHAYEDDQRPARPAPQPTGEPRTMSTATAPAATIAPPHCLTVDRDEFKAIVAGERLHLLRVHGRNFQIGDILHIEETQYTAEQMKNGALMVYTSRYVKRQITHVQAGRGIEDGFCILSFKRVEGAPPHD